MVFPLGLSLWTDLVEVSSPVDYHLIFNHLVLYAIK